MQKIIENMSAQPATCVIASVLLFFFAALANYILMDGLLEMHRSKSALKKLKKQYTFKINHKVIFDYLFKSSYMPV